MTNEHFGIGVVRCTVLFQPVWVLHCCPFE